MATAPDSADCTAYYKFEDLTDEVGSNDLTNNGATSGATGILDDGYSFDGNDEMTMSAVVTNSLSSGSMSMWVKFTDENTDYNLFGKSGASFRAQYSGSQDDVYFQVNGEGSMYTVGDYDWTQWHHLIFVWDGTNKYIYVDGVLSVSAATTSSSPSSGDLYLGHNSVNTNERYNGLLDELSVFDVALTADNVEYLYNSGSPTSAQQYPFSSAETNVGNLAKWCGVEASKIAKINGKRIQ